MTELFTENLPPVRCAPELKQKLELVAAGSISQRLSDHVRHAVEQYVEAQWTPELEKKLSNHQRRRPVAA